MKPWGVLAILMVFGSSWTLAACSTAGLFEDVKLPPPTVILRTPGGEEQQGELGSYCWGRGCADMRGAQFSSEPVMVSHGATIRLDFTALGTPTRVNTVVYEYDEVVENEGQFTLIMPGSTRHGPPALETDLPPANVTELSLDIDPGHYVLVTQSWHAEGDSSQGFHFIIN